MVYLFYKYLVRAFLKGSLLLRLCVCYKLISCGLFLKSILMKVLNESVDTARYIFLSVMYHLKCSLPSQLNNANHFIHRNYLLQ